jgi:hypothetical protein
VNLNDSLDFSGEMHYIEAKKVRKQIQKDVETLRNRVKLL